MSSTATATASAADQAAPAAPTAIPTQGSLSDLDSPDHIHLALAQVLPSSSSTSSDSSPSSSSSSSSNSSFAKLHAYAREASQRGADVVAFPEYFLTGATHQEWYGVRESGGPGPAPLRSAQRGRQKEEKEKEEEQEEEEEEKHWVMDICALAKELDINIVAGTVVELGGHHHHAPPHRSDTTGTTASQTTTTKGLYNTAYFIGREGSVQGRYTKRNLWHPERHPLTAGHPETHPSPLLFNFTTRRGKTLKAGMQICWDLAFPESFRDLLQPQRQQHNGGTESLTGPDVIFVPTCWYATDAGEAGLKWNKSPTGEAALLDSLTSARALECESLLCMINISGPPWDHDTHSHMSPKDLAEGEPIGVGRTCIKAPFLGTVGLVEGPEEKLLLGSVDLRVLDDARSVYKIREDLAS